ITPYEARWGKKPDLSHLRVWGCRCYAYYPKELETKGGRRMYEGIFVGYDEARKGYWIRESANGRLQF
ncbi:uncharacterized protein SCHCODRAFT_02466885, partial [Schizophyllum commune H4-8]|uniref:uncharacterized protein n=1 Tax=Schizophyllum commune (strain H4-8 / FGSC 9210) TaxID=578458 RepID=UPI00215F0866